MKLVNITRIVLILFSANSALAEDFDEPTSPFVIKTINTKRGKLAEVAITEDYKALPDKAKKDEENKLDRKLAEDRANEANATEVLSKASLLGGSGANSLSVDMLKYTLKLGDEISLPFMLYTTTPTTSTIDKKKVISSILDIRGGLLNLTIGNRTSDTNSFSLGKFCDFETSHAGGCYYHWRLGVKMAETPDQNVNSTTYFYDAFISGGLKAEFPIYDNPDQKAGYLIFNLLGNVHYLDANKISALFSDKPKNTFSTIDAAVTFYIQNQLSIAVGGTLGSTDSKINKSSYVRLNFSGK